MIVYDNEPKVRLMDALDHLCLHDDRSVHRCHCGIGRSHAAFTAWHKQRESTVHIEEQPLLTKQQVCELLGVNKRWLDKEIREGNIPCVRLSRKKYIRFRPSQIEEYLASKQDDGKEGAA